jgi:putative phosphoesterase
MSIATIRVGLISDTHGLLRSEALEALRESDFLIHAGDIGDPGILERLERIAPVTAVRGNTDTDAWAAPIPETAVLQIGAALIYVIHDIDDLDFDPAAAGFQAVVAGHSHRPSHEMRQGVHFVNPGSAGPRRSKRPISVGHLIVTGAQLVAQLCELAVAGHPR